MANSLWVNTAMRWIIATILWALGIVFMLSFVMQGYPEVIGYYSYDSIQTETFNQSKQIMVEICEILQCQFSFSETTDYYSYYISRAGSSLLFPVKFIVALVFMAFAAVITPKAK